MKSGNTNSSIKFIFTRFPTSLTSHSNYLSNCFFLPYELLRTKANFHFLTIFWRNIARNKIIPSFSIKLIQFS